MTAPLNTSAEGPIAKWVGRNRTGITILLQGSAFSLGIIGTFLATPPEADAAGPNPTNISRGFVAVLIGAIFVLAMRFRALRHAIPWLVASVLLMLMTLIVFISYQAFYASWTCKYVRSRLIIGSTYTADADKELARSLQESHHNLTCEDLVFRFAGDVERIWNPSGVNRHRVILIALYLLVIAPFVGALVAVVQAMYCSLEPPAAQVSNGEHS